VGICQNTTSRKSKHLHGRHADDLGSSVGRATSAAGGRGRSGRCNYIRGDSRGGRAGGDSSDSKRLAEELRGSRVDWKKRNGEDASEVRELDEMEVRRMWRLRDSLKARAGPATTAVRTKKLWSALRVPTKTRTSDRPLTGSSVCIDHVAVDWLSVAGNVDVLERLEERRAKSDERIDRKETRRDATQTDDGTKETSGNDAGVEREDSGCNGSSSEHVA